MKTIENLDYYRYKPTLKKGTAFTDSNGFNFVIVGTSYKFSSYSYVKLEDYLGNKKELLWDKLVWDCKFVDAEKVDIALNNGIISIFKMKRTKASKILFGTKNER